MMEEITFTTVGAVTCDREWENGGMLRLSTTLAVCSGCAAVVAEDSTLAHLDFHARVEPRKPEGRVVRDPGRIWPWLTDDDHRIRGVKGPVETSETLVRAWIDRAEQARDALREIKERSAVVGDDDDPKTYIDILRQIHTIAAEALEGPT